MKRTCVAALLSVLTLASATVAHAAPKKGARHAVEAPKSAAIAQTLGDLRWGMTREQVLAHFEAKIKKRYEPLFSQAPGESQREKLRASMGEEIEKLHASVIEFSGQKTGADESFLHGEFTHHNGESLVSISENSSDNYYFFIQNRLWKWYKTFDRSVFEGKSFDQFARVMQSRYGRSERREGEAPHGSGKHDWLEWQDENTRLRAIDNTQFYGFYGLVLEDKATLARMTQLRTVRRPDQHVETTSATSSPSDRAAGKAQRRTKTSKRSADAVSPDDEDVLRKLGL